MERLFAGRIVLIGAGAIGLRDLVATPMRERELGVVVHAQAVEQMVLGDFLERPDWTAGLEMAVLLGAGILLALLLPSIGALPGALLAGGLMAAVGGGSWYAFKAKSLLVDPTAPMLALLACYVVVTLFTYLREEKQRRYIHGAFDRYLSPELVRRITDDPSRLELGGEVREMTVLFCDIRGFSHISEQMGPQEIIRFLIAFLTPMTDILLARQATIDKYIGDAILAFWNAPLDDPDQHENAARAALEMIDRLEAPQRGDAGAQGRVLAGAGRDRHRPQCRALLRRQHGLGPAPLLFADRRHGEPRLADRGADQGLWRPHPDGRGAGAGAAGLRDSGGGPGPGRRARQAGDDLRPARRRGARPARRPSWPSPRATPSCSTIIGPAAGTRRSRRSAENEEAAAGYGLAKLYARYRASIRACREHPPGEGWDGVTVAETK